MPFRTVIAGEEKSIPGFKASRDKLTLLLGAHVAVDFKLKPVLIYHSENPKAVRILLNLLCYLEMEQQSLNASTSVYNVVY